MWGCGLAAAGEIPGRPDGHLTMVGAAGRASVAGVRPRLHFERSLPWLQHKPTLCALNWHWRRDGSLGTLFRTESNPSEIAVPKLKPSRDIQPVTEFRANAAQFIEQVRETGEPVILTQHGKSAAVLLDVDAYEAMMDEIELLRDIRTAEEQVAAGKGRPHADVARKLRARLTR